IDSLAARGVRGAIVVAIDSGGSHRMDEYNPWKHATTRLGGGEGERYVEFLARNLKPYIDARFRTRTDAKNTTIAGSSMGGLISLYASLTRPNVFGNAKDQTAIARAMNAVGFRTNSDLVARVAADGRHEEWFWRREFPAAYLWLMGANNVVKR
ncbi:MAG: alpha/beta hydrolase-fold protein, partial [Gemmatimonas sp.]